MRYIRRYTIEPNGRCEPFVHTFITAHEKAKIERVETYHSATADIGILWIQDLGDPEELEAGQGTMQRVFCVPLFSRSRQAPVPDECGEFLGAFQDDKIRWFVFAPRVERANNGEQVKSAPSSVASSARTAPQQQQSPRASSTGARPGNRSDHGGKRNP